MCLKVFKAFRHTSRSIVNKEDLYALFSRLVLFKGVPHTIFNKTLLAIFRPVVMLEALEAH